MDSRTKRVVRLEERQRQRHDRQPAAFVEEGIQARVHPGKGTLPGVVIHYDSLRYDPDEAVQKIGPRLPPDANVFVFPFVLTVEQWTQAYGKTLEHI